MPEGVLKDLSTGRRDRKANRVIREPDSWKVGSEGELLERIRSFSDAGYQRVLWLDTANHNVIFGIGYDHSFVSCSDRRDHENVHFPPLKPPPKPDDEWSDIRIEFALWGDDLAVYWQEELMPLAQALEIVLWVFRHDALPEINERGEIQPRSSPEYHDDIPF